jgi:integrase
MDLVQISVGSPALKNGGLLPIREAARASGFDAEELLDAAAKQRLTLYLSPTGIPGVVVRYTDLDLDPETGGYDVPTASQMPDATVRTVQPGVLRICAPDRQVLANELRQRPECQLMLFDVADRDGYAFAPTGGLAVTIDMLQVSGAEIESQRQAVAAQTTPEQLAHVRAAAPATAANRYASRRMTEAVDKYMKERSRKCKADQARRVRAACDLFVELTGNPRLGDVDREFLRHYRDDLLPTVPADENKIRLTKGTKSITESIAAVSGSTWPRISESERAKRMQWLCGLFEWLCEEKWLTDDPAAGLARAIRPPKRGPAQRRRDLFTRDDLGTIFGEQWFKTGRGTLTAVGTYREFSAHYFWLPLIGLYTGARINELCQLSLSDIRQTQRGVWYFDITEEDDDVEGKTTSVKNVSSFRAIPVHPHLIQLGLVQWRSRLASAGFDRLFPELLYDEVKGYSKAPVKWFSGYLRRLGWPRTNRKVFHSFRHTLASECLNKLELSESVTAQISGHQRSTSILGSTYRKDIVVDQLAPTVARLDFNLPAIAPFDLDEGMKAVRDALARKRNARQ